MHPTTHSGDIKGYEHLQIMFTKINLSFCRPMFYQHFHQCPYPQTDSFFLHNNIKNSYQ